MKNRNLKIMACLIIICTVLSMSISSFAIDNSNIIAETVKVKTEQSEKLKNLTEVEKSKAMQPNTISVSLEDSIKRSTLNILKAEGESTLPTKYNLKEDGGINITVKDQYTTNDCWAFAALNLVETNTAKSNNGTYTVLSPRYMEYATSKTFLDGVNQKAYNRELNDGGNYMMAMGFITAGNAPISETSMPFQAIQQKINLSEIQGKEIVQKVEEYTTLPTISKTYDEQGKVASYTNGLTGTDKKTYTDAEVKAMREIIKRKIMNYGSLGSVMYGGENSYKYSNNDTMTAYYCNNTSEKYDHAITIVGWDDDYSIDNFKADNKPKNKGAYIVLESYGENRFINGYQYISYDDVFIENSLTSVQKTGKINYDNIYQYDDLGYSNAIFLKNQSNNEVLKSIYAINVFDRKAPKQGKKEYLNEVSLYVYNTSNIEIYANLNSDDKTKIEKIATPGILESGYHTIKLSTPLEIKGEKFILGAKYENQEGAHIPVEYNYKANGEESNFWDTATASAGQSFVGTNTSSWLDIVSKLNKKDTNVCVKGFSTYEDIKEIAVESISLNKTTLEMTEGETTNLIVSFNPTDATNKNVKWLTDDKNIVTVDANGNITAVKEGKTTITAMSEDGDKIAKCEVTVNKKKTNDDDIYKVPDDESKTQEPTQKSTADPIQGSSAESAATGKTVTDPTVAQKIIPYAGNSAIIIIAIMIVVGTCVYWFIKFIKYRDIK